MKKPNSEIVFHNSSSRETQIWFMDGGKIAKRRTVKAAGGSPIFVGVPWKIVGAGDFKFGGGLTPNGGADILWVNTLNQQTQIWTMDGDRIIDKAPIISEEKNGRNNMTVGPPWQIIGLGAGQIFCFEIRPTTPPKSGSWTAVRSPFANRCWQKMGVLP
jgi:hypothetical protein